MLIQGSSEVKWDGCMLLSSMLESLKKKPITFADSLAARALDLLSQTSFYNL